MIGRIEALFNPGSADYPEDGLFLEVNKVPLVVGVSDAYSRPYDKQNPIILFNRRSSGEMVKQIFWNTVSLALPHESLETAVMRADEKIRDYQKTIGFPNTADELAGTAFAVAKIEGKTLEIFQGGDCTALWMRKDLSVNFTCNRVKPASEYVIKVFAELVKKHGGDRKKARVEFTPLLKEEKIRNINKNHPEAYAAANGQLNPQLCHKSIQSLAEIKLLLLFTDGFILREDFNDYERMRELAALIYEKGLNAGLERIRGQEKAGAVASTAIGLQAEATAVAIWFK